MTIKNMLLAITLVLVGFIVFLSGKNVFVAYNTYQKSIYAEKLEPVVEDLLNAADNWAVERGVTNSALASATKPPQTMLDTIKKRRAAAEEAYENAMAVVKTLEFEGKDTYIQEVESAHKKAVALRAKAEKEFTKPAMFRDVKISKSWVPTMTDLILKSQKLRFNIGEELGAADPKLAFKAQMKHFSWIMSEYAGRERAILGGTISSKRSISSDALAKLSRFRGAVESAWDTVEKISLTHPNAVVDPAIEKARQVYFTKFQTTREKVYEAGNNAEPYPLSASEWIKESTNAINSLLGIKEASIKETSVFVHNLKAGAFNSLVFNLALMLLAIIVAVIAYWIIQNKVIGALTNMTDTMIKLSEGDTSVEIDALGQKNEMGTMAASVQVFKENAIEKECLEAEQIEAEKRAEGEKKAAMNMMANDFDSKVGGLISSLASASTEMRSTAETMQAIAEETNSSSQTVAAASEESSVNVNTVAAAMEEMAASSSEIAAQITQVKTKSNDTAVNARAANETVSNLNKLATNIGEVVLSIQDIAEQTNLLALNATIEAARAGEAGKGFAVVADEVKKLATETGQKTEEISIRIQEIQNATGASVNAMESIISNISEIDDAVTGVSAAVEEQNATTAEISRSVGEASDGTQQVSSIIIEVQKGAAETGTSAEAVFHAATEVSELSENLKVSVDDFLEEIKSG